jgi:hypothetical protein
MMAASIFSPVDKLQTTALSKGLLNQLPFKRVWGDRPESKPGMGRQRMSQKSFCSDGSLSATAPRALKE